MRLSPPKKGTWLASFLLGSIAILNHYGNLRIPLVSDVEFLLLTLSFLLLLLSSLFEAF